MTEVITWVVDSGDGVYIGGNQTHRSTNNTLKTMTTSCFNESIDQELSNEELGQASGGIPILLGILAAKVIAGTVATGGVLIAKGIADGTSNDVYSPPEQEGDQDDSGKVHY